MILNTALWIFGRRIVVGVALGLAASLDFSWAVQSCHIHPPGRDVVESGLPKLPLYASLDECESANARYFGGAGRCHCFPDFSPRQQRDPWPEPRRDFEIPGTERFGK
jgi:hypothetical protein